MEEEKKVIKLVENGMDKETVQQLLEENDVNVDGESNISVVQCISGC